MAGWKDVSWGRELEIFGWVIIRQNFLMVGVVLDRLRPSAEIDFVQRLEASVSAC